MMDRGGSCCSNSKVSKYRSMLCTTHTHLTWAEAVIHKVTLMMIIKSHESLEDAHESQTRKEGSRRSSQARKGLSSDELDFRISSSPSLSPLVWSDNLLTSSSSFAAVNIFWFFIFSSTFSITSPSHVAASLLLHFEARWRMYISPAEGKRTWSTSKKNEKRRRKIDCNLIQFLQWREGEMDIWWGSWKMNVFRM